MKNKNLIDFENYKNYCKYMGIPASNAVSLKEYMEFKKNI